MLTFKTALSLFGISTLVGLAGACSSPTDTGEETLPTDQDASASSDAAGLPLPGVDGEAPVDLPDAAHDGGTKDAATPPPPPPPPPPPAALVRCMRSKPYVEQNCTPTTVAGWPHPAQACTYGSPIGTLSVTVADPSAAQVATWIVDAGDSLPAIKRLKTADPASYLRALQVVASALMIQSSRIFPIQGAVGEDQGDGYYAYPFTKGVTTPCPTGEPHCYCRINSLSRGDYCAYRANEKKETAAACRARVGYGGGVSSAWQNECIGNHAAAWNSATNEHIRAQVWARLNDFGITASSSGTQVVNALQTAYGVTASTTGSFCN